MEKKKLPEQANESTESIPAPVDATLDPQIADLNEKLNALTTLVQNRQETVPDPREKQIVDLNEKINSLIALVQAKQEKTPDPQEQQIAEIQKEMSSLATLFQIKQEQGTVNTALGNTMSELRELKALVKSSMVNTPIAAVQPVLDDRDCCGDQPCDCVSSECCCFDISMTYVRVLAMQPLELDDSNVNPWGELEIKMFAYLDGGLGAVIPSMFSTLTLKKLIQHPGLKISINRNIGTVCLPKGKSKMINIGCDVIEEDSGLIERITGGRDEEGSNSAPMILDCCCNTPITTSFDVNLTSGGQGGGAIEVGFTAIKKC